MDIVKPRRLRRGDLIGLVTPASPVADHSRIEKGVQYLERLGYRVTLGEHVGNVHGYLAGTDDRRLADLHRLFADRRVKAIIALRGGYGTPRLLSRLNYKLLSQNPKILVGYSDITALQLALWHRCGMITFDGPMAAVDLADVVDGFTEELFWRTVTSTKKVGRLSLPPGARPLSLHIGKATGRLVGGNLSIIVSLLGTRYLPSMAHAVLFLEEISEEPYRVDRMLTHLRNARVFSKCNAVLTGQFSDCLPKDLTRPSLSVEDILTDVAQQVQKPFLSNLPFGHVPQKMTLPVGLSVRVDAGSFSIEYLESAVS